MTKMARSGHCCLVYCKRTTAYTRLAGNHDLSLDPNYALKYDSGWTVASGNIEKCRDLMRSLPGVVYLQHSGADIQVPGRDVSIRVFGSPYSPEQLKQNWAFQYPEKQAHNTWEAIPSNTDIFITHTPPAGYCDASQHWIEGGCPALAQTLSRIKPAMHICGHCHEGRGAQVVRWDDKPGVVNSVRIWEDTSIGTKKQSLLDLTGHRGGRALEYGRETAVINASVMAKSWDTGAKSFNKPIVVDIDFPTP